MCKRFIIGDIHGSYSQLNRLIDQLALAFHPENDKFIFLGDYVSHGSESFQVIDFLISLQKYAQCIFLLGDHDHEFLSFLVDPSENMNYLFHRGGQATLKSYERQFGSNHIPENHLDFFHSLRLSYE